MCQQFEKEQIPDWKCTACSKLGVGSRSYMSIALPDILIVQIKRFAWRNNTVVKLNNDVRCPLKELAVSSSSKYDLVASINHHGSVSSGHYSAYVNLEGCWFGCDDRNTFSIESNEVISPASYLLIFRRSGSE